MLNACSPISRRNPMKVELKVLSGIAMQSVVEDLGPKFERETGYCPILAEP
jgi:hypothetical protein